MASRVARPVCMVGKHSDGACMMILTRDKAIHLYGIPFQHGELHNTVSPDCRISVMEIHVSGIGIAIIKMQPL